VVVFEEGVRKNFSKVPKVAKNIKFLKGVEEAERAWDEARQMGGGGAMSGYGVSMNHDVYDCQCVAHWCLLDLSQYMYGDTLGMAVENGTLGLCYVCHQPRNTEEGLSCQVCDDCLLSVAFDWGGLVTAVLWNRSAAQVTIRTVCSQARAGLQIANKAMVSPTIAVYAVIPR